ncbi:unnamed protein product [Strongylus vulgaris]|uniref:Uncharacterized protein n=1 Tax=Strongylus vulgaris TaxID=40348 RepID=A0A3P7KU26_STRVU|nr:unnamed protein product [Strongylus vulgaris]
MLSASVVFQKTSSGALRIVRSAFDVATVSGHVSVRNEAQGKRLNRTGGLGALGPSPDRSPCSPNVRDICKKTSPQLETFKFHFLILAKMFFMTESSFG